MAVLAHSAPGMWTAWSAEVERGVHA